MPLLETNARRRKAHTKSRQGCGNCKLRRVKCDETRPKCNKCVAFGVDCDYESRHSNLQFAGVGAFQVEIPPADLPDPIDEIIKGMMNAPLDLHVDEGTQGPSVCYIDQPHLDLLRKFQRRTVLTIGTRETSHVYRDELIKMASKHSFILHAILRITLMHDRYLYDPIGTKPSTAETFHSYHGVALFSKKLSAPLIEDEKDAMWGTAAMFGACAFASIEASSFENAWPLKQSELQNLDWLKMSEGKKEVWRLSDPLREGSVWRDALIFEQNKEQPQNLPPTHLDLDKLFPYVIQIYNLERPEPEDGEDPYRTAASIIERLVPIECTHSTIMWFLSFLGHMDPRFRQLLEVNDPSALVLLSWWYAKLIPYGRWWMSRRALFECQAICIYLDKVLPSKADLRRLMEFPRKACGLQPATLVEPTTPEQLLTPSASSEDSWQWKQNF